MAVSGSQSLLVRGILQFGDVLAGRDPGRLNPTLTDNEAANELLISDDWAFLAGVIGDYQMPAERAWAVPYELSRRLGGWSVELVADHPKAKEMAKSLLGFKDIMLVGFFLTIGLSGIPSLADLGVALFLVALIPIKVTLYFGVMTRFNLRARTSLLASLGLSTYSEFGLIVGALGVKMGWLTDQWLVIIAVSVAATFIIASPINAVANELYDRSRVFLRRFETAKRLPEELPVSVSGAEVLIIGMGGLGTAAYDTIAEDLGGRICGLDNDRQTVARHVELGRNVVAGDPTDLDFWDRISREHSVKVAMLALPNHEANLAAAEEIRNIVLVGHGGAGKTTLISLMLGLLRPTSGSIRVLGLDPGPDGPSLRAQIGYGPERNVLPDDMGAYDFVHHLAEVKGLPRDEARSRASDSLYLVGLGEERFRALGTMSTGQRQRVKLAQAIAADPRFIVLDEPVSAVDVSIQAQVLNLLKELQDEFELTYLFISHDLNVVEHISDRVAVMYLGKLVELATSKELYHRPLHPYTQALLASVPHRSKRGKRLYSIAGAVPNPAYKPHGCPFHPRCPHAIDTCREKSPDMCDYGDGHLGRCPVLFEDWRGVGGGER